MDIDATTPLPAYTVTPAEEAERLLLLGLFGAAADAARALLQTSDTRQTGAVEEASLIRGAFVLLQALFELGRHDESARALTEAFGSVEGAPHDVLLLWVSQGLESGDSAGCQDVLERVLHSAVSTDGGVQACGRALSGEQYAALCHMYVLEVLGQAGGCGAAHARAWVHSGRCLLLPEEQEALLDDLQALQEGTPQAASSGDVAALVPSHDGASALGVSMPTLPPRGAAAGRASTSGRTEPRQGGAAQRLAAAATGAEIEPQEDATGAAAASSSGSGGGAAGLGAGGGSAVVGEGWFAPYLSALMGALGLSRAVAPSSAPPSQQQLAHMQGSHPGVSSAQWAAGLGAAALLAYAAYAERQPIRRAVRRGVTGVQQGLADTAAMAFGVAVNPVAAASQRVHSRL